MMKRTMILVAAAGLLALSAGASAGMSLGNGLSLSNGLNLGNGLSLSNGLNLGNGLALTNGVTTMPLVNWLRQLGTQALGKTAAE